METVNTKVSEMEIMVSKLEDEKPKHQNTVNHLNCRIIEMGNKMDCMKYIKPEIEIEIAPHKL